MQIIVVGGGAAGFFSAITAKLNAPEAKVSIVERHAALLSKVKVSGGGRCNVTHACFEPKKLVQYYPRGHRELLGPFHHFNPTHTVEWFESRGITLKVENDGRMFPVTNCSQTIIDCLMGEAERLGIKILTKVKIKTIEQIDQRFHLICDKISPIVCDRVILTTGSSPQGHLWAQSFGHQIITPVPSLFTFNVPQFSMSSLSGVSIQNAKVRLLGTKQFQEGPLLITHFGFSGPAVLKLSAWAARELNQKAYDFKIHVSWVGDKSEDELKAELEKAKSTNPQKRLSSLNIFELPKSLWKALLEKSIINLDLKCCDLSKKGIQKIVTNLVADQYHVQGKTLNKEEFVTCGGVKLSEVNFKTMESKKSRGLYFAGEILDIDGVTGGFNFQNAWTTGYLAGTHCVHS